jgi:tetratricopeptide (TPR) repeat protein
VSARLLRVEDGARLWETQPADESGDLLRAQDLLPAQVVQALGLALTEPERRLIAKRQTESLAAYRLYLKGRHLFNRRTAQNVRQMIASFERAVEIDPGYAPAHAALAHINTLDISPGPTLDKMQRARAAAAKALSLDDTLAEAHMALGRALIYCDWDWDGSERAFKRAIELSPNYPEAHFWYSHNLSVLGRHDEALAELRRTLEIDPLSPRYALRVGTALHLARQYDRAIEEFRKAPFEVDSAYYQVYWRLGIVYVDKGMYPEAIATLKKAEVLSGELPLAKASLAYAYAKSGPAAEARKILAGLDIPPDRDGPYLVMAGAYGCLGEKDQSFKYLEKAYERREPNIIGLRVSPMLDSLRSDPRFEDLLRRTGLTR